MNYNPSSKGPLLSYTGKMTGIRCINNIAIPTSWDITIDFVSIEKEEETQDQSALESSVKFQMLSFWINEYMQDVIVISIEDEDDIQWAKSKTNGIMTTPEIPTDDMFSRLMLKKISTIVGDRLMIVRISIISDDGGHLKYTYYGLNDEADDLPGIEYANKSLKGFKKPWWERKTAECFDYPAGDNENDNVIELHTGNETDILSEYEDTMRIKYKGILSSNSAIEEFTDQLLKKIKQHQQQDDENKVIEFPTDKNKK